MSTASRRTSRDEKLRPGSLRLPRRALVFREVNEQIARLDEIWGLTGPVSLMCECGTPGCTERIEISATEYEEVRRFPTHFVVRARHAAREGDRVVRVTSRYVVVEKSGREASEAIRFDPHRRDGGDDG